GCLHFASGSAATSPLERLEVVGEGSNVVVDNGVKLTWYRKAKYGEYGRTPSWIVPDDEAPLHWEPECSLGRLYNSNLFTAAYAQEIRAFGEAALEDRPPDRGGLSAVREIVRLFEAYRTTDAGQTVVFERN